MNIQYYGDYCFKITTKPAGRATEDIVVWTDVPEKETGLRAPQGQADVVFLSHQDEDHGSLSGLHGEPVIFTCPGEYAVKGMSAIGLSTFRDDVNGVERGQNTLFIIETEELRLGYLGALGHMLTPEMIGKLGAIDILFVPAGGRDTLSLDKVDTLVRQMEPKAVIPMHYGLSGMNVNGGDLKDFCAVMGNCPEEIVAKWNVKAKDLEGKSMEIVVLEKN